MFIYIFSKDKHIASIYGDDVRIMQDYKIINVFNENDLIASIDFCVYFSKFISFVPFSDYYISFI